MFLDHESRIQTTFRRWCPAIQCKEARHHSNVHCAQEQLQGEWRRAAELEAAAAAAQAALAAEQGASGGLAAELRDLRAAHEASFLWDDFPPLQKYIEIWR